MNSHESFNLYDDDGVSQLHFECPTIMTAGELLSMKLPPINWVIPNLLHSGLSLIAEAPKIGKSYLLLKLAKDIIERNGSVFYFAGEDSRFLLQSHMQQLAIEPTDKLVVFCGRDGQLARPNEYLEKIDQILLIQKFDAVFLDNMEIVLPERSRNTDDYSYYYKHLPQWAELGNASNCSIVMTHHTTKEHRDDPFKNILGSQAIMGSCDSVFVLERGSQSNQFNLHATGKFIVDEVHSLKLCGTTFEFDGSAKEADLKNKKGLLSIHELVSQNPQIKQSEIAAKLKKSKGNVSRDIAKLIQRGLLKGCPEEGYAVIKLADNLDNLDN